MVLDQTITEGIVSAAEREISGHAYIQHTAAVNPGNSGGPLLDNSGHLAGLVTLKADLEGVSFAIPAAQIRANYEQLRKSRRIKGDILLFLNGRAGSVPQMRHVTLGEN